MHRNLLNYVFLILFLLPILYVSSFCLYFQSKIDILEESLRSLNERISEIKIDNQVDKVVSDHSQARFENRINKRVLNLEAEVKEASLIQPEPGDYICQLIP